MHPVHAPPSTAAAPRYPAPVSARRALAVVGHLDVAAGGAVLDVAEGPSGLLFDTVVRNGCRGVGLVASEAAAETSRAAAEREGLGGRIEFRATPPPEFTPTRRFDAILCVAGLGQPAAPADAAPHCLEWLRAGGVLLCGEPYFRRAPSPGYREVLGSSAEGLRAAGVSARAVVAAGFELLLTVVLSESEWDAHETAAYRTRLAYVATHAGADEAVELRGHAERWYQAYWKHGRDTLGYAFHAFRKPRHALHVV
jgi:SAM-dependent methyltransferase